MLQKFKKVEVVWHDAYSTDDWTSIDELDEKPLVCSSIGWLVKKTKAAIVVAGTINATGGACCSINIPRGMVQKITYLQGDK